MMIVAIIAGMGMMLGLVGCGGKSESEIKADIEKTAIEKVQKKFEEVAKEKVQKKFEEAAEAIEAAGNDW